MDCHDSIQGLIVFCFGHCECKWRLAVAMAHMKPIYEAYKMYGMDFYAHGEHKNAF